VYLSFVFGQFNYHICNSCIQSASRIVRGNLEVADGWVVIRPSAMPCTLKTREEVKDLLDANGNWYWNVLTPEAQEVILDRAVMYLENLPKFIKAKYGNKYNIRAIIVKRAYLYGYDTKKLPFLHPSPYDLDITVIVQGDSVDSDNTSLTDEEVFQLFGDGPRNTPRVDVKILGEEYILKYFSTWDTSADTGGDGMSLNLRAISDRGSGITIAGPEWFSEKAPAGLWIEAINESWHEAEKYFEDFMHKKGEYYFSQEVQNRFIFLLSKAESEEGLVDWEARELETLQYEINKLHFAFSKAIKRLTEGFLQANYFLTNVRPDLADNIIMYKEPENMFTFPNISNILSGFIVDGLTIESYRNIFSENGIAHFMYALAYLFEIKSRIKFDIK